MEEKEEMEGKKGRKLGRERRRATPNIILHESQSSHNHCPFSDSPAYGQFVAIDVTDKLAIKHISRAIFVLVLAARQ